MAEDFPVEVTLTDGSKWIVYYRGETSFARCIRWIEQDIRENRLLPADDLDGVQRRSAQVLMGHVVSFREALDHSGEAGSALP